MKQNSRGAVHFFLLIIVILIGIVGIGYLSIKNGQVNNVSEEEIFSIAPSNPVPSESSSQTESDYEKCVKSKSQIIYTFPRACLTKDRKKWTYKEITKEESQQLLEEITQAENWKEYAAKPHNLSFKYPSSLFLAIIGPSNAYPQSPDRDQYALYQHQSMATCASQYYSTGNLNCDVKDIGDQTVFIMVSKFEKQKYDNMDYRDGKIDCIGTKLELSGNTWYICETHQSGGTPEAYKIFTVKAQVFKDGHVYPVVITTFVDNLEEYAGKKLVTINEASQQPSYSEMRIETEKLARQILSSFQFLE